MYIEISRYIEFKSIFVYMYNVNFWKKGDQLNRNLMIVYIKKIDIYWKKNVRV